MSSYTWSFPKKSGYCPALAPCSWLWAFVTTCLSKSCLDGWDSFRCLTNGRWPLLLVYLLVCLPTMHQCSQGDYRGSGFWTRFLVPAQQALPQWGPVLYLPASLHTQRLKVNLQSKTRELDTALECVCCTWDSLTALLCQLGKVSLFAEMSSPKIPVGCKRKTYVSPTVQISIHETPKSSSDPYQLLHTFR